jgi:cell division protein FtsZ
MVEIPNQNLVEILQVSEEITGEKYVPPVIHFELSSDDNKIAAKNSIPPEQPKSKPERNKTIDKEASTVPTSGGYLAKPSQIYEEEQPYQKSKIVEEPTPLQMPVRADEPVIEMQLVVKNSLEATEEIELNVQQTQPIMISTVEEPLLVDEADESRRRAMERIAKLRNLSFNLNAADPNNEFESVPAYLRRNMELHNSIADVESFYSNYTVKSDQNNQAEISTINTFLEGKKPD